MTAPKVRWFRFGLRTMFVLVTAACVALGWDASKVFQRRALLRRIAFREDATLVGWSDPVLADRRAVMASSARRRSFPMTGPSISPARRILGDRSIAFAVVFSDDDFESFRGRFPEATTLLFDDEASYVSANHAWEASMVPPITTRVTLDAAAP